MTVDSMIGEAEVHRRQELHEQRRREVRAKSREKIRQQLAAGTRKTFVFLLGATVLVFVLSYRAELQDFAKHLERSLAATISRSAFQQDALSYEQQVDEIAQ